MIIDYHRRLVYLTYLCIAAVIAVRSPIHEYKAARADHTPTWTVFNDVKESARACCRARAGAEGGGGSDVLEISSS